MSQSLQTEYASDVPNYLTTDRDLLKNFYSGFDRGGKKSLKVVLYDADNDANKTVRVSLKDDAILENAFIKKELLSDFKKPLKECDSDLRDDLVAKMKDLVNVENN